MSQSPFPPDDHEAASSPWKIKGNGATVGAGGDEGDGISTRPWPVLDQAALYGLPGEVVKAIEPHTEADPVAILAQFLVAAGNAIGRGPHYAVEGDRHAANLYVALAGRTSKGRKGTSYGRVRQVMTIAAPDWAEHRIQSGLVSGEGLIWHVRDPIFGKEKRGKGSSEIVELDPGIVDKRLLAVEPELERLITAMGRDGNTLSSVLRDAWDRGNLSSLSKNAPARASGAHFSMIGHITVDELRAILDRVALANGFANRVLWVCVQRRNVLPFGGNLDPQTIEDLGERTGRALRCACVINRVGMTDAARAIWRDKYPILSAGKAGLLGAITARAEAQAVRLALIYALLDTNSAGAIDAPHLQAALALCKYAEHSAEWIWGDALGDPVADDILRYLRLAGTEGRTRTDISKLFSRNRSSDEIGRALAVLVVNNKAVCIPRQTAGRRADVWIAIEEN
jgi:hypothetical protein